MLILQTPTQAELNEVLKRAVQDKVIRYLQQSQPGHCLRVTTLPRGVMYELCKTLNDDRAQFLDGAEADVVLLVGPRQSQEFSWEVTATRLIELRNAGERPLLAFIPPGLKAAAEDSFDVSTFVEIDLGDVPAQMQQQLRAQIPDEVRAWTDSVVDYLGRTQQIITSDDALRYYLTLLKNPLTGETVGGALYQLGLIPDFALTETPDHIRQRLDRNLNAINTLVQGVQPLLGRILELKLKANTLQADLYTFLQTRPLNAVGTWAAEIAAQPAYRHLSFDQWSFEGEVVDRERPILYIEDPKLSAKESNQPIGPDNPMYLDVNKARTIGVRWTSNPKPATMEELAYFRLEIVSADNGATAWESGNIRNNLRTKSASRSKSLKVPEFRDQIEDGLYFFRVRAYSEIGEVLNEEDTEAHPEILRDPRNPLGKRTNETDDIWFWDDPNAEAPPVEPQRNVTVFSFQEARLHVQFAAVDRGENPFDEKLKPNPERTGWATAKGKRAEALYHIVYDAQTRFTLPFSTLLRRIEEDTLAHPETWGRWRLNFSLDRPNEQVTPAQRLHNGHPVPAAFQQARAALFQAILQGEAGCLVETADLLQCEDLILAYVDAYSAWMAQIQANFETLAMWEETGRRHSDALFLDIDTVEVLLPSDGPLPDRVYLLAPTHPLRLLWHLQRARMARAWIQQAVETRQPKAALSSSIRAYLQRGMVPVNLPPVLRAAHEKVPDAITHFYIEQGALTPFWGLYIREDVRDGWALRARVLHALGIGRRSVDAVAVGTVDETMVTQKLLRYLVQHPYVRTLKINVFNPGDAGLVVDAILSVEKQRNARRLTPLRYELRLFARSGRLDDMGEAVEELLNPERQVSAEADAFTIPSQNHLFPKLRFSRNRLEDYLQAPERYEAHIAILHDLFPVGITFRHLQTGRSSFAYGLIQEQVTAFAGGNGHYAWQRQLLPTPCQELAEDLQSVSAILAKLLSQIADLQASVAAGKKVEAFVPTLHLHLSDQDKRLLYEVHNTSDWIFIIDRHLGLEYFDSDTFEERAVYLLDFTPEFCGTDTDRLLLTTRAVDEVTRLIHPVLEEYALAYDTEAEVYFLQLLRSLSGRLALKLLSAPNSVGEALGLAMARLFLEQYGLLEDCIVLPLDAHVGLFAEASQDALTNEVSLQRGDLLLVSCDPEARTLHFHIIEVKWRKDLGDINVYIELRQRIEGQLMNSEETLRIHFDPQFQPVDRVDRQVKTKELISLLSFYLERSRRYGLVSDEAADVLRPFIESLDRGYTLTCAGAGIIFDFAYSDISQEEEHAGLVFHRVGGDYIRRLLENGLRRRALLRDQAQKKPATIEETTQQEQDRHRIVRDTSMRKDKTYPRVRTYFKPTLKGKPEDESQKEKGESRKSKVRSQESEGTAAEIETSIVEIAPEELGKEPLSSSQQPTIHHPPSATEQPISSIEQPVASEATVSSIEQPVPSPQQPAVSEATTSSDEQPAFSFQQPVTIPYDVLLGDTAESKQYGLLGKAAGKILALDLNGTNTISLFGVQGSGKSYTVGSVVEMATQTFEGINVLPSPLATVIFHYHESQDYPPEFVSMVAPNNAEDEVKALAEEYGAHPKRLEDVVILTSADKLSQRRAEFPSVEVQPLSFSSTELSFKDWRFLMGVFGNQMYMKQINLIMRQLRDRITLATLRKEIEASDLSDSQKSIARIRLDFAGQFINDAYRLADHVRPGRMVIVDLRDEFIDKDEALGLFVVMLNIFANAGRGDADMLSGDRSFNKLIVFDEAHKYMDNPDLTSHIVDVIRQMRHQGVSVLIASQDPPSLPNAIIELSSLVILHRFNSPQWLKHIQRSITALADLTPTQMASLRPGEAYMWATKATERIFTQKAVKVRFRPRVTQHGGGTKRAV
ncbi:MAG: hypothetical protein JXA21_23260 [Anaerolineae bacterium]|nr:hypothetical protein [Anaerolineae bacterium]